MWIQFSDWVGNIVGKEEIARYEQFLLFPQCFQKLFVVDALEWVSVEERVNSLPNEEILDWFRYKLLADNKINGTQKFEFVFGWVENILGKF